MDATLVRAWNETVGAEDEIWHLGDFAIKQSAGRMNELLGALNGIKRLVRGNNDGDATAALRGWAEVVDDTELVLDGRHLLLTHHPLERVPDGALNLHGHSHGRRKPRPGWLDVGVDVWDFRPVAWERLR
jgi:calcineurin-like phosphoesterase family protein